jgi:hypothetical protein
MTENNKQNGTTYVGHFIIDHCIGLYVERIVPFNQADDSKEIKDIVDAHDTGIWEYFVDTDLNTPTYESLNLTANDGAIHYCIHKSRGRKLSPLMFPHRVTASHGIEQLTESERNAIIEVNKQLPVHDSSSCECTACQAIVY